MSDTIDYMLGVTESKPPVELLTSTYRDIMGHLSGHFMAGVGFFVAILLPVLGTFLLSAIPLLPLLAVENEIVILLCGVLSGLIAVVGILYVSVVKAPCYLASVLTGIALHHREGIPLALNTVWKHYPEKRRDIVLVYLGVQVLTTIGIFCCIVPGLLIAFATLYALPLVVLYKMSPTDAIRASGSAISSAPGWHILFWLLAWVSLMLFAWIPILGTMLAQVVLLRLTLGAAENSFGPAPVST